MGPGYFPILLGIVLAMFGAVIAIGSIGKPCEPFGRVPWRGVILVTAAVVFFAVTARSLGMLSALFIATMLASYSTPQATLGSALGLSAGLTAFNILVFVKALGLRYPIIGPWLSGWLDG